MTRGSTPDLILEADQSSGKPEWFVHFHGLHLSSGIEQSTREAILEAVRTELERTTAAVAPHEVTDDREPSGRTTTERRPASAFPVSADGLGLSPGRTRLLEQSIGGVVADALSAKELEQAREPSAFVSVVAEPSPRKLDLDPLLTIPHPWVNVLIAVYCEPWDGILLTLNEPTLRRDMCTVKITREVDWNKKFNAWSSKTGGVGIFEWPRSPMWASFDVWQGTVDTLVFWKPKLFGFWWAVAHFNPAQFWQAFGGTKPVFNWRFD